MDLHWCGYAMYFRDIQTPCSQFKRRDKFLLMMKIPNDTECKNCHQQELKNYTNFVHTPSELKVIACVTSTLWTTAWRASGVIYSNYHPRSMTPSYMSLLGTNFRPQPFYKLAESWNFSDLLVFKSCYEGELQSLASREKKWTLKGNFVKIQDLRLKLML